jgi:hypothetical protein
MDRPRGGNVRRANVMGAPNAMKIGPTIENSMCCAMCIDSSVVSYVASDEQLATSSVPSPSPQKLRVRTTGQESPRACRRRTPRR